jgi:hypothetical protein
MRGHLLRDLELAAIAHVFGNPHRPKRVIANLVRMPAADARWRIIR